MFQIPDLPNGSPADQCDHSHLAGGQAQLGIFPFLCHELGVTPGTPHHLAALSGIKFNIVDMRSEGNVLKREGIADSYLRLFARNNFIADSQANRGQDIFFFSIYIMKEGDICGAIGIILDRCYFGGDAVLVPLEVDYAIKPAVAATPVPTRNPPQTVSSSGLSQRF
jgi:hypothetical protein